MSHVIIKRYRHIYIILYRYSNARTCNYNTYNEYMYAASLFAEGNSAWKRAALEGGIEFHEVKHVLLQFSRTVRPRAGSVSKLAHRCWTGNVDR